MKAALRSRRNSSGREHQRPEHRGQPQIDAPSAHRPFRREQRGERESRQQRDHPPMQDDPAAPQTHGQQDRQQAEQDKRRIVETELDGGFEAIQHAIEKIECDACHTAGGFEKNECERGGHKETRQRPRQRRKASAAVGLSRKPVEFKTADHEQQGRRAAKRCEK